MYILYEVIFLKDIKEYVRTIPDFPKKGIMFRDITTVLSDPDGFKLAIDTLQSQLEGIDFDIIAGVESRGFIFAGPIAFNLKKAFIPIRKKGKLPYKTIEQSYDLEYGSATLEIHEDAIKPGQKVVLVDDLIATGGSIKAAATLVEKLGAEVVKILFLIELPDLGGRSVLKDYDIYCATSFDGE